MTRTRWVWALAVWLVTQAPVFAGTRTITVTGTLDDPLASVTVNGTPATVTSGSFTASTTLTEGNSTITATSTDPAGNSVSASVSVSLDTIPPVVVISFPADGQLFGAQ